MRGFRCQPPTAVGVFVQVQVNASNMFAPVVGLGQQHSVDHHRGYVAMCVAHENYVYSRHLACNRERLVLVSNLTGVEHAGV